MRIHPEKLILSHAGDGFTVRRVAAFFNCLIFWVLALYLFSPLVMLVYHLARYGLFKEPITDPTTLAALASIRSLCFPMAAIGIVCLFIWALYNRVRFRRSRDKRNVHPPLLTIRELGKSRGIKRLQLEMMRGSKSMVCYFNGINLTEISCEMDVEPIDAPPLPDHPPDAPRP